MKPTDGGSAETVDEIDSSALEEVMGYHARRASLVLVGAFLRVMAAYELGPVDFSVLLMITHNPGITSRQLCAALGILPPNLVGLVNVLEERGLIRRRPHPRDGRALGLYLTTAGHKLMRRAEPAAKAGDDEALGGLGTNEKKTLRRLLQKIYL